MSLLSSSPLSMIALRFWMLFLVFGQIVEAFTPTFTDPAVQCAPFTITWELQSDNQRTGPPYTLLIIPFESNRPIVQQLPDEVWDATAGRGSYTIDNLPLNAGERFIVVLDDGFARAAGEVSQIHTVSSDSPTTACLDSLPPLPSTSPVSLYTLSTSTPSQCGTLSIDWAESVSTSGGVEVRGFVPGGQAFTLNRFVDTSTRTYDWTVNLRDDEYFILLYGGEGGRNYTASSPLMHVQGVTNGDCINNNSPSHTAADVASGTQVPIVGGPSPAVGNDEGGSKIKAGAIAGGVVGGLAAIAIIAISIFFYVAFKKQRKGEVSLSGPGHGSGGRGKNKGLFSTKRSALPGFSFASTQNRSETSFRELDPHAQMPNDFGERRDAEAGSLRGKYGEVVAPYVVPALPPTKDRKNSSKRGHSKTGNGYPPPPPNYPARQGSASATASSSAPRNGSLGPNTTTNVPTHGSATLLSSNYPSVYPNTTPLSSFDGITTTEIPSDSYNRSTSRLATTPSPLPPVIQEQEPQQWPNEKHPRTTSPSPRPLSPPLSAPPLKPPPPPPPSAANRPTGPSRQRSARSAASEHNPFNSPTADDGEDDEWDGSCNSHPYALARSPHTERAPLPLPLHPPTGAPVPNSRNGSRSNTAEEPQVPHPFAFVERQRSTRDDIINNDDDEEVTDAYAFAQRTRGPRLETSTGNGSRQPIQSSPIEMEPGQRTRFVRHRDAGSLGAGNEDDETEVSEDDGHGGRRRVRRRRERRTRVVELPPLYSEAVGRR